MTTAAGTIRARMEGADWARLVLLSAIWGGSFLLTGVALAQVQVLTLVAARVAIAAVVLWGIALGQGRRVPADPRAWGAFAVIGLFNNALPFSLIALGQTALPAGLASILNATTPLFTVLVGTLVLADERAGPARLAGVVLGLAGVAVMMGLERASGQVRPLWAGLSILGAALCYAISGVYGRRFVRLGVDPVVTAAGMVSAAAILLVPLALAIDGPPHGIDAVHIGVVAALGAICTGLAYMLYFGILARAGATNISLVTFLVPVWAVLLGAILLGEVPGPAQGIGMGLIALGLALIDGRLLSGRIGRRRAPPPAA
jgi:drug/metabolite transporter (DMT)-like permease